ncbi:hypothetical protein EI77_00594 [Prosthecobacter fusiformis]|uniref:Uncharacterized protein n=1 Tax=Prosthecobacter fusiformis TaxID=48464 RepID=A0A4R7SQI6_9BACT|nr:DUF6428 family protein [Prosthecobacter fusiformis]TDU81291.1 hypothetical protein EI77_00594 [Prosthecobacter fusiformis]
MNITEFLSHLESHSEKTLLLVLPDGGFIPAHFHITEVGHVKKNFIDCGGTRRSTESCLLQTWTADDTDHRLVAGKLSMIFGKAGDVLPHHDLPVEIEFEDFSVSQFPVTEAQVKGDVLVFQLGLKHTDCLAKELCLPGVCGPAPKVNLLGCAPGSGCC